MLADLDAAAVAALAAGEDAGDDPGGGRAVADDGEARRQSVAERQALEQEAALRIRHAEVFDDELAGQGRVRQRRGRILRRAEPLGREMLHDLIVFDLHVEALLVPVDQLLQGRRQLPVGGDDGDELADIELPAQGEIAAHRIEEERRQLRQEVVQELDDELPLVDAEADVEELVEAVADLGALPGGGVVHVHDLDAVDDLADAPGEPARGELALLAESQELAAKPRDDEELHPDDAGRDEAEPDVLNQDEDQRRGRLGAEEQGQDERVADEAADRLDLILDDGGRFRGLDGAQGFRREAHDQREELEAHAPEHALAERSLGDVDPVFEGAVDDHQQEEHARQAVEQAEAVDLDPLEAEHLPAAEPLRQLEREGRETGGLLPALEGAALDRLVDDPPRQVEGGEVERQGGDDHGEDDELVAPGMPPDIAEEVRIHELHLSGARERNAWLAEYIPVVCRSAAAIIIRGSRRGQRLSIGTLNREADRASRPSPFSGGGTVRRATLF